MDYHAKISGIADRYRDHRERIGRTHWVFGGSVGFAVVPAIVNVISNDYLLVTPQKLSTDGSMASAGDGVKVAKPFELRVVEWDNQVVDSVTYAMGGDSQMRNARDGDGNSVETQYVTPKYEINSKIFIVRARTLLKIDGQELLWTDLNVAGRAWATADLTI